MLKTDIVISWVDGSDPEWLSEKSKYQSSGDDRPSRYRDMGILPYLFRGVEKFLPWAGNVFFITWGHLPSWLDTSCERLHIINHRDYIPAEYLPTFSSNTIELNFHRIEDLSENFIYFNDDTMITRYIPEDRFFSKGSVCDMLALQPIVANEGDNIMPYMYMNNTMLLAKHFDKRSNFKKQPLAYAHIGYPPLYFFYNLMEMTFPRFTGFYTVHGPAPLKKSVIARVWDEDFTALDTSCRNRFRSKNDVNQYLFREWTKLSGDFHPINSSKGIAYYGLNEDIDRLCRYIEKQKYYSICINDSYDQLDFQAACQKIKTSFERILPDKSAFEK